MLGQGRNSVLAPVILLPKKKNDTKSGKMSVKQKFAVIAAKIFCRRSSLQGGKYIDHTTAKSAQYIKGMTPKIAALENTNKNLR